MSVADLLLDGPATRPPVWRDRFGDDAAFLKIRYGRLSYEEGFALLETLNTRVQPPVRLDELRYAHARPKDRAHLAIGFREAGLSGWHARFLGEGPESVLAEMKRWGQEDPPQAAFMGQQLATALAGLDDPAKIMHAASAEEAGLPAFAVDLLSTARNLQPLIELLDRQGADADRRAKIIRAALLYGDFDRSFDISVQPREVRMAAEKRTLRAYLPIFHLMSIVPEANLIQALLNVTGDERLARPVAASLLEEIDAGRLDPRESMDEFYAAAVRLIDLAMGRDARVKGLAVINQFAPGQPYERAEVIVNEALARLALGPFLRDGRASAVPDRPDSMTRDLPWDLWVTVALDLQAGRPVRPEAGLIAAELFVAAGRPEQAVGIWRELSSITAMRKAHALLRSLDRKCARLIAHPMPYADPFYRFDQ